MMSRFDSKNKSDPYRTGFIYDFPKTLSRKVLLELIYSEHTYAKPFSLDPDFNRTHSTKILLLSRSDNKVHDENEDTKVEDLDVLEVGKSEEPLVEYDRSLAVRQMSELEKCFQSLLKEESWQEEDGLTRIGWTRDQTKLYDQVIKVLSTYQLARCTYKGNQSEEILRHVAISKAAKRFRNIAAGVTWDPKVMSWLHSVLVDGLSPTLFLCYLELLQALMAKVPSLIEKMMQNSTTREDKNAILNSVPIMNCLKRPLDPSPTILSKRAQEKRDQASQESGIENKPLLLMLPRGPALNLMHPKRFTFWGNQLSGVAKTCPINVHNPDKDADFSSTAYLENVIGVTRTRVSTSYSKLPGRPVVLIGWSVGALLACQVSLLENVAGIICLGYPCYGLDGLREIESDPCVEAKCPVMFVIGTHSSTCSTEFVEALREKMRVDTRLLVVPGGDEVLKLTSSHKKRIKMTQNMVDQLIMDEVEVFISGLLSRSDKLKDVQRPNTPSPSIQQLKVDKKRKHKKPESEKEVVDKKKKKSPALQKTSVLGKRDPAGMIYDPSKAKGATPGVYRSGNVNSNGGLMTPSELTKAATRNLASNASPTARGANKLGLSQPSTAAGSSAIISSLMSTNHSSNDQHQAVRHSLKHQHGKMNEKMLKKLKTNKKPLSATRSFSPLNPSQSGLIGIQQLPSASSIVLSSSGAQVRLQDGRILYVPGSDPKVNAPQGSFGSVSNISSLSRSSPSIGFPNSDTRDSSAIRSAMLFPKGSAPIVRPQEAPRSFVSSPLLSFPVSKSPQSALSFANFAAHSLPSGFPKPAAANSSDPKTASSPLCFSSTLSTMPVTQNTVTSMQATPLTSTDLKYLAKFFQKKGHDVTTVKAGDVVMTEKVQEKVPSIPTSPISAKIGIGTLTNLPNPDGSPPGSGTRASPSSKQLPPKDISISALPEAPKMKALLSKHASVPNKAPVFPKRDLFDQKKVAPKGRIVPKSQSGVTNLSSQTSSHQIKNLPVTVTIPTHNNSRGFTVSSNSKSQTNATVLKGGASTSLPSPVAQQRVLLSTSNSPTPSAAKSAVEISQLIRKVTPTSSAVLDSVNNRQIYALSSSSKLTVTGRPIQSSPLSNKKNPQTITLHIPNTAVLKDPSNLRKSGSEIKLIGLLNQKGRSPMSSPIHFSVQSKSAPGSPQAKSPTIVFTSKSDLPSPKLTASKSLDSGDGVSLNNSLKDKQAADNNPAPNTNADTPSLKPSSVQNASIVSKEPNAVASIHSGASNNMPISKKLKQAVKFTKPATIQTALIKSLTAASLSPQQQESITALLKNQGMKNTATSSSTGEAKKSLSISSKNKSHPRDEKNSFQGNEATINTSNSSVSKPRADMSDVVNGHASSPVKGTSLRVMKSAQPNQSSDAESAILNKHSSVSANNASSQLKDAQSKDSNSLVGLHTFSQNKKAVNSEAPKQYSSSERNNRIESQGKSKNLVPTVNTVKQPVGKFKECAISLSKIETVVALSKTHKKIAGSDARDRHGIKLPDNQTESNRKKREGLHLELNNGQESVGKEAKCNTAQMPGILHNAGSGSHNSAPSSKISNNDLALQRGGKRPREEIGSLADGCSEINSGDDGPSTKKIAKKGSTSGNERKIISTPQKTEE